MKRRASPLEERIGDLVRRHALYGDAGARLMALLEALADERSPTSIRAPTRAIDVHVADSLAGLEVPGVRDARLIADLGAGAGLPGLALAAALPATRVVLVESSRRKCDFMLGVIRAMGLSNAEAVASRAEEWHEGRDSCHVVTARALAALPVLCEYAAPLLREGGILVAWKGAVAENEAADGRAAGERLGLEPAGVRHVVPFAGSQRRTLHVFRKVAPTPPGFPRRPGMAAKRPLSAAHLR